MGHLHVRLGQIKKKHVVQVTPCKKLGYGDRILFFFLKTFFLEYSDLLGNVLNKIKLI